VLELIERFLAYTGIHPDTFGRLTVNNPELVYRLRMGETIDKDAEEMILTFMQRYEDMKE
jgi:hypothetical protein